MSLRRTASKDIAGDRHRLRWEVDVNDDPDGITRVSRELKVARLPGVESALVEAQSMVLNREVELVEILDVEADDVLYTVQREGKDVVTHGA